MPEAAEADARRKRKVRVVVASLLVVMAVATYLAAYSRRAGHMGLRLGRYCFHSATCFGAPCIHDSPGVDGFGRRHPGSDYCSKLCESDDDCPRSWVCERTFGGPRACMKGGEIPAGYSWGRRFR